MTKGVKNMTWETMVKKWGNTGGITLPKSLVGKKINVSIEVQN